MLTAKEVTLSQIGAFVVLIVVIAVSMFSASSLQGWALLFSLLH